MTIIDEILESAFFADRPPVLLDIGASGEIHPKWQPLARHAVCIAFDADDREFNAAADSSRGFKRLHLINRLVTATPLPEAEFHLTRFPYSSSLLEPDGEGVAQWNFGDLFEVDRRVRLKAITLPEALRQAGVSRVDWFKTDSQGTDLRLFASLGPDLIRRVLVAEFEPGILDAYKGEDKLHDVMRFMESHPFWMSDLQVRGTQRVSRRSLYDLIPGYGGGYLDSLPCRIAPGWAEVAYFNTFPLDADYLDPRDHLLGWIFAFIEGHYGFALDIAGKGRERFGLPIFQELARYAGELLLRKPA